MSNEDSDSGPSWSDVGNSTCLDWRNDPNAIWDYCPSFEAAILFAVLFFLTTTAHLVQSITYRKSFGWVVVMAGAWECVGFAVRAAGTQYQRSLPLFIPQQLLILLAPIWINAYVYMVFGRMLWYFVPEKQVGGVKAEKFSLIFVLLDVLSFLIQGTGGGMQSNSSPDKVKVGIYIYMAGLALQQAFLIAFGVLLVLFHRRVRSIENTRPTEWRWLLYLVYAAAILITMRIIFRLVEFASGVDNPILHTESYIYIFDALPMFAAIVIFNFYHPGRVLVGPESEFPKKTREEKMAEIDRRKEERRQWREEKKTGKAGWFGGKYKKVEGGAGKPGYETDKSRSGGRLESDDQLMYSGSESV